MPTAAATSATVHTTYSPYRTSTALRIAKRPAPHRRRLPQTIHSVPVNQPLSFDEWIGIALPSLLAALLLLFGWKEPFNVSTSIGVFLLAFFALVNPASRRVLSMMAILLMVSVILVSFTNQMVIQFSRHPIDAALLRLDGGVSPAIYRWTLAHSPFKWFMDAVYYGLPIYISFVLIVSPRRVPCAWSWIVAALLAPLFYLAFPAVGPAHVGDPLAPRNCVPSLHMSWALIGAFYIAPRYRALGIAFALLTAAATLATGEHYWLDLLVAVPYTAAVCAAEGLWTRRRSAKAGLRQDAQAAASSR